VKQMPHRLFTLPLFAVFALIGKHFCLLEKIDEEN